MIKKNPETLNEIKAVRNVLSIAKYYNVSQEFIDEAYDFIIASSNHSIRCGTSSISFYDGAQMVKTFAVDRPQMSIDGLTVTAILLTVIPHYVPMSSGGGGGGWSSGGGSSNNNNNH